jgi:hypothetical protein
MGAHPYWYFVPYQAAAQAALNALRLREFNAGRYSPVLRNIDFDPEALEGQRPGPAHDSVEAAVRDAARSGEGTRSILDVESVGGPDEFGVAAPLSEDAIWDIFDTDKPVRAAVEEGMDEILGELDRGQCVYMTVYGANGKPAELAFFGYSYD